MMKAFRLANTMGTGAAADPLFKINLGQGGSYVPTLREGAREPESRALTPKTLPDYLRYMAQQHNSEYHGEFHETVTIRDEVTSLTKVSIHSYKWDYTSINLTRGNRELSQLIGVNFEGEGEQSELTHKITELDWVLISAEELVYIKTQGKALTPAERSQIILDLFVKAAIEVFKPKDEDGSDIDAAMLAQLLFKHHVIKRDENGVVLFNPESRFDNLEFGIHLEYIPEITIDPSSQGLKLGLRNTDHMIKELDSRTMPIVFISQVGYYGSPDMEQYFAAAPTMVRLIDEYFSPSLFISYG